MLLDIVTDGCGQFADGQNDWVNLAACLHGDVDMRFALSGRDCGCPQLGCAHMSHCMPVVELPCMAAGPSRSTGSA